jgi:CheY-like chemotaxis protein
LRVLLFDDFPEASENKLLQMRLRQALASFGERAEIFLSRTVADFEAKLNRLAFDCLVLDIMAESGEPLVAHGGRDVVAPSLTGIELLRRCRAGVYRATGRSIPIYMRSARGEPFVIALCKREGCTGYYHAGAADQDLIRTISEAWRTQQR